MIEDMTIRKLAPKTQASYIRAVRTFAAFLGRTPDQLASSGVSVPSQNATVTALRFFFAVTLRRSTVTDRMPFVREPRRLPVVLSPEEVVRLLEAAPGLKYRAALSVAYGAGLRANEVVSLKIGDIDSTRMVIRVEQGKGGKDRYVMLSAHLLELLRAWWKIARPQGWLFPGQNPVNPLTTRQLNRACHAAALRHSFATHLIEQKVDIRVIQVLLGHKKLDTTALYSQVATKTIREVTSPLERLTMTVPPPA